MYKTIKRIVAPVPSLFFQHIPVLQELSLLHESANGRFERNGKRFDINDGAFVESKMNELPCPPDAHGEEFESWIRTGDIAAAFFGHDHTNTFTAEIDGIKSSYSHPAQASMRTARSAADAL